MFRLILVGSLFCLLLEGAFAPARAATDVLGTRESGALSPEVAGASRESSNYEFAAPPASDTDLIYRVDPITGEVSACAFSAKGPTVGSTVCLPSGEGAGPQPPGNYGLVHSNLAQAKGLFRVNRHTGEVSACYVLNERVVCTAPAR